MRTERRRWLLSAALTLVLLVVIGFAAVHYQPHGSTLAAWWPTSGIAVAFLARSPRAWRPLFLAAMPFAVAVSALWAGRPVFVSIALGVANVTGTAVVMAVLARRSPGRVRLQTLEDLWLLLLATIVGSAVTGVVIAAALSAALGRPLVQTAISVMALNAASVLLISPLGMDVSGPQTEAGRSEQAGQSVLALLALTTVFGPGQHLPVDFLPIPLLMWGAMRLPVRLVTVQLLVAGVVASVMTRLGNGPIAYDFVTDDLPPEIVSAVVQAYLVCLALVVLPLALVDASATGVPGAGPGGGGALPSQLQRLPDRHAAAPGHPGRVAGGRGERGGRRPARHGARAAAGPAVGEWSARRGPSGHAARMRGHPRGPLARLGA